MPHGLFSVGGECSSATIGVTCAGGKGDTYHNGKPVTEGQEVKVRICVVYCAHSAAVVRSDA
jgi:hypothetical protein